MTGVQTCALPILAVAIVGLVAIGIAIGVRYMWNTAAPAGTVRFEVQPPADVTLTQSPVASAAQLALWVPFVILFPLWFFRYRRRLWLALEFAINPEP